MKKIKEYFIPAVLIIILCIYLWQENPDKTNYNLPKLDNIFKKDISKIEIIKKDTTITLKKNNDKWHLEPEGYLADTDKINKMSDVIENLSLTAMVSESKNYNRYGLDREMKIIVKGYDKKDNKIREFEIGKPASLSNNTFIKIENDHRVYHAKGNFRSKFDNTVSELRDAIVLSFNSDEIDEIYIKNKEEYIELKRKQIPTDNKADKTDESIKETVQQTKDIWVTKKDKEGKDEKIKNLLFTLSALKCDTYITNHKKDDFKEPVYSIILKNKKEYRLSVFSKINDDDKKYPAITSENSYPFYLTDYQTEKIMLAPSDLIKSDNK